MSIFFRNFVAEMKWIMEDNNDNIVVRYDLPKNWSEEKNFSFEHLTQLVEQVHQSRQSIGSLPSGIILSDSISWNMSRMVAIGLNMVISC